jgi:peptidyl-prolyl cis-trans isomerase D
LIETRDIKYIDVLVTPSEQDRADLLNEVTEYAGQLASATELASFIRSTGSTVAFPEVAINKEVYPSDIAGRIDSVKIGEVFGPYYNQADDSYNVMKVLAKEAIADSIQFRQIQVFAETAEKTQTLADSIYTALKGGANFEEVAKIYGQTGESSWLTARNYEGATMAAENVKYVKTLIESNKNEMTNLNLGQVNLIVQVLDKKAVRTNTKSLLSSVR